ncbi:GlxA family transcriptional regulator [Chitinophaga sp. GCM10012297]|uniref:Helix-turn-helix domain-containing protein n=1 Tax=Chitinophaga chungangae TaxID=2821488 RepID=A0ABS3YFL2_9BACT|nr:helix-turn-helix domain-containing protein [Chitinophaga chungangae]MBO9153465.1 helix-turn-helix domain-containing protein [Chitinophaga chungangae]
MKHVTIVVPQCEVNMNSIGGAFEILTGADNCWRNAGNESRVAVQIAGFTSEKGIHQGYFSVRPNDIRAIGQTDLVIVPSLFGNYKKIVADNQELIGWIDRQYKAGSEIASMCTGAFLLAATGLLDNKSSSTHWMSASLFKQMYPAVKMVEDRIITDENGIYTNGGGYSFLNLMLYLVEKIFDRATAIFCSKVFQIDIERTSQSQFSIFHIQKGHGDELINRAQLYIEENIEEKISFEKLAYDLAISRRNFDRRFVKATGNTPVEYLQRVKVEAAKKELERGRKTVFEVMSDVGYADDKAFREVFKKITGLSPLEYRNKYNKNSLKYPR